MTVTPTDPRLTPANDRAALESLRGKVDAPRFTVGEAAQVILPSADLLTRTGARDRQLFLGDGFTVVDRHDGMAFGQSTKDGHCGYLSEAALGAVEAATHWVAAPGTHLYPEPRIQAREIGALPMGARVTVEGQNGSFSQTTLGFVPTPHLRKLGDWHKDPVAVAQTFLGTPYLWGGNTRAGIDCSGLAQIAYRACGHDLPSDSDLQMGAGKPVSEKAALKRGDLIFWKGHVALAMNADHIIHATAAFMAVVVEPLRSAVARIKDQGAGPVLARRRIL
jgi:cell wall-associated NlpC family hydrolase